jgi:hypothetical protein
MKEKEKISLLIDSLRPLASHFGDRAPEILRMPVHPIELCLFLPRTLINSFAFFTRFEVRDTFRS